MATEKIVRVGVAVFVIRKDGNILYGIRKGSHGSGTFQLPGGYLEFGETFIECAIREVMEETGLEIKNVEFLTAVNAPMLNEGKHSVAIFMKAYCKDDNPIPKLMEPEKCEGWDFTSFEKLSKLKPLFLPLQILVARPDFTPV